MITSALIRFLREEESSLGGETVPVFPVQPRDPSLLGTVELELRASRDHLAKLRFNWHEMKTKSLFLELLSDGDEWRACQTSKWTPGELKQVETVEVASRKTHLQTVKRRTADLQLALARTAEGAALLQPQLVESTRRLRERMEQWNILEEKQAQLQTLLQTTMASATSNMATMMTSTMMAGEAGGRLPSVEELRSKLGDQEMATEKRLGALERQRAALADLERRLAVHTGEVERLHNNVRALEVERDNKLQPDGATGPLGTLCNWYAGMRDLLTGLTGWMVELVQIDYLLATFRPTMLAVHMTVEASTGRLLQVRLGTTSATPRQRQWRELVEAAIEYNDIPFLLRAIQATLQPKPQSQADSTDQQVDITALEREFH